MGWAVPHVGLVRRGRADLRTQLGLDIVGRVLSKAVVHGAGGSG